MTKKMTIAEAVLTVAEAVREVKDAQQAHQASQDAFTQTVNEALAQVISRDEVALMIKEAELDDVTHEDVQQAILAAVADKSASEAVNEANAAQDAAIATLISQLEDITKQLAAKANTSHTHPMSQITGLNQALVERVTRTDMIDQINTLAATQTQSVDLKSHKIVQQTTMLSTAHGLIPTYTAHPITFTPKTGNFISISGASATVEVNRFITADETGDYALNSGWVIDHGRGRMAGNRLTVYEAGEIRLTHPQLNSTLIITAKALTKADAAQQYLDGITPKESYGNWNYGADAGLLEFAKDEIDSVFWRVDSSSSLFLFNHIHTATRSGDMSMADVLAQVNHFTDYHLFTHIDGSETTGSPLKEFGFVLKDGTRLSRSFS